MVVGSTRQNGKLYYLYRCPPNADCPNRVTISAEVAERAVVGAVQDALAGMRGTASIDDGVEQAERAVETAEGELDATVRAFDGLDDVEAARERLTDLREARDQARDRLADLQAAALPAVIVTAGEWDLLSLDERRALVRAVVDRAVVRPGRGSDRVSVELRGE